MAVQTPSLLLRRKTIKEKNMLLLDGIFIKNVYYLINLQMRLLKNLFKVNNIRNQDN